MKLKHANTKNLVALLLLVLICGIGFRLLNLSEPSVELYPTKLSERQIREVSLALQSLGFQHKIDPQAGILIRTDDKLPAQAGLAKMNLPSRHHEPHKPHREASIDKELAKSIRDMPKVEDAFVRVSIPNESYFEDGPEPSARIYVRLVEDEELSKLELLEINQLLQSSVPTMKWKNVRIVDSTGQRLAPVYEL